MNSYRVIIFSLPLLLFSFSFKGVSQQSAATVRVGGHYGFIIDYNYETAHLVKSHIPGGEISIGWQGAGHSEWEKLYHFPEAGVSVLWLDFRNPKQLGMGTGVIAFLNFPVYRSTHFTLSYRIGSGPGYISKTFDRVENYKNNVIGAHFNAMFNSLLEARWKINPQIQLSAGAGMTHFSNGAVKMPNLGINIPTAFLSINYSVSKNRGEKGFAGDSTGASPKKNWYRTIIAAGGLRDVYPSGGYRYKGLTLSSDYNRIFGSKRAVGPGLDLFYDESLIFKSRNDTGIGKSTMIPFRGGVHISHYSLISRITLGVQFGFYFFDTYKKDGSFYHRLVVRYRFGNHIIANLSLKTHWARADYLEWGVGYEF